MQDGLNLTLSETPKTGFLATRPISLACDKLSRIHVQCITYALTLTPYIASSIAKDLVKVDIAPYENTKQTS